MKISDMMNLSNSELKVLKGKHKNFYRSTDDYMKMFSYLTATEALELCNGLSEIPVGHRCRGNVVNHYSKLNEQRKHLEMREEKLNNT